MKWLRNMVFTVGVLMVLTLPTAITAQNVIVQDNPWGQGGLLTAAMNDVFGGAYTNYGYAGLNAATVFTAANTFVYLEGGDGTANTYNGFLTANFGVIQAWVNAGGRLYLNAAPNVGGNIVTGFGATQNANNYDAGPFTVGAQLAGDMGWGTPANPVTGNFFTHAYVTGGGTTLIQNGAGDAALAGMQYGGGFVTVGGMTTPNWWAPQPANNALQRNILNYAANAGVAVPEPGSMILLATGLFGMVGLRRRRQDEVDA